MQTVLDIVIGVILVISLVIAGVVLVTLRPPRHPRGR